MTKKNISLSIVSFLLLMAIFFGAKYVRTNSAMIHDFKSEKIVGAAESIQKQSDSHVSLKVIEEKAEKKKHDKLQIPSKDELLQEVAQNPEAPPHRLVQFAQEAGERLGLSLNSLEQSILYFDELEDCLDPRTMTSAPVKSLCLAHAKILASKYHELKNRLERLGH